MASLSPTMRTLAALRNMGIPLIQVVERWNAFARIRQDLFGFIDILAIDDDGSVLAVQATSGSNVSARVNKIKESNELIWVRAAGWKVQVWGWRKLSSGKWEARIVDIS